MPASPVTVALPTHITKRDGRIVPFDPSKIVRALERCFQHTPTTPDGQGQILAREVTAATLNVLARHGQSLGVEEVQRYIVQQLWAGGHFEAALAYQNHRENHRLKRQEHSLDPATLVAVTEDAAHFPSPLQYYQFVSKFARYRHDQGRRETWREAITRVINWFRSVAQKYQVTVSEAEWHSLDNGLFHQEATCSLRVLQMAGPALERCEVGVYNCAYAPIVDLFSFAELLYILMQGSGMGFSVETDYISQLPRIKKQKTGKRAVVHHHKIADSTEGWCDAFHEGLKIWFAGEDVTFDDTGVRPAGSRLHTKGGRSSGPGPLRELLAFARQLVLSRQGSSLSDLDVHDLCCMAGKIVQVGGVRRASCISLSDLDSSDMRHAKSGNWWEKARWRTMANNSAVFEEKPEPIEFLEEWLALAQSGSGERGIFNRVAILKHLPKRRKRVKFGGNPCMEIIERPYGFCNLSIVVAREGDTEESLTRKVRIATFFGKLQALCTDFRYIRPEWKKNCQEERLIGVDITGHADCPLLRYGAPGRGDLLGRLARVVEKVDLELSARWGVNPSAANTCVKPAGDSAVLFDCASGVSPRFAAHQLRWVRQSVTDPVTQLLKDEGVPWAVAPEDPNLVVFAFPMKAPEGATVRNDLTAIQQLENWLEWKLCWAEHSVSATIYVEPHEWLTVGNWVYDHFDDIPGLAFLPKDNGFYTYAPNEEISQAEYQERVAAFPTINWAKLPRYERDDTTTPAQNYACTGDRCAT